MGNHNIYDIHYELFNNGNTQGYVLKVYANNTNLHIWASEPLDKDVIMVVIGCEDECSRYNTFNSDASKRMKYFDINDFDLAVDYVYKQIKYYFKDQLNQELHIKYDVYKSIDDIRRIQLDADGLGYDDYYELASFFNEDEQYSCDLIISNGKMGYRYNKHLNGHLERLTFQETEPNLDNEITLMLDMEEKLNNFMNNELIHDIEFDNTGIKI